MSKSCLSLKKRVFVGFNDAGSAGIYSFTRILRNNGHQVDFYGYDDVWVDIKPDYHLKRPKNRIIRELFGIYYFVKILFQYDLFHLNFAGSFFWYRLNYPLLKLFNKKIINTFRGSDVYDVRNSVERHGQKSAYYDFYVTRGNKKLLQRSSKIDFLVKNSDRVVLIGPWLKDSVSKYDEIITYSRDIKNIHKFKQEKKKSNMFKVFHAPTNKKIKGTEYVVKAVENLKKKGIKIQLDLADKISIKELYSRISQADVVIDQLLLGWYGGFAVEAMALEKPVICYLKNEYIKVMKFETDIPIINANEENLEKILEKLINAREDLEVIGRKSYEFVKKIHDAETIADHYLNIYTDVLGNKTRDFK